MRMLPSCRVLIFAFCFSMAQSWLNFPPLSFRLRTTPLCRCSTTSDNEETDALLKRASELREEAQAMEEALQGSRPSRPFEPVASVDPISDIKDSQWTFSYRFSNEPEKDDDKDQKRTFYSGKVRLHFLADGYTDLVEHEPRDTSHSIVKVWGWDMEQSNEDEKEYLLFSMDVEVGELSQTTRFYFQARQEKDSKGGIRLEGGTVTVKQDFVEAKKSRGLWGLFNPTGILAQFRYVGDFVVAKSR